MCSSSQMLFGPLSFFLSELLDASSFYLPFIPPVLLLQLLLNLIVLLPILRGTFILLNSPHLWLDAASAVYTSNTECSITWACGLPEWQMCSESPGDFETWEEREDLTVSLSFWECGICLRICGMMFVYYNTCSLRCLRIALLVVAYCLGFFMFLYSNCSHLVCRHVQVPYGSFALPCSRILSDVQSWSQPWRIVLVYNILCFLWAFFFFLGSSRLVLSMDPFLIFVFPWPGRAS